MIVLKQDDQRVFHERRGVVRAITIRNPAHSCRPGTRCLVEALDLATKVVESLLQRPIDKGFFVLVRFVSRFVGRFLRRWWLARIFTMNDVAFAPVAEIAEWLVVFQRDFIA